ncbi:hypothetical protein PF008_g13725 [Phytophthora fragariae]|uniref:Uncharacterized protein n=1 Tax=Phytophthora fragariae TaxID=53985 RepID=A0A6G0RJL6_9STRA|nr:hypothetical protein PF008_g13725 [Phytophthora fragariae]
MVKKRAEEAAPAPAPGDADVGSGAQTAAAIATVASVPAAHLLVPPPPAVAVAMLSKAEQSRVEYRGGKGELLGLGEIYLNDLSDIFVFEVTNLKARRLKLQLRAELRKPFQSSQWGFQLENENVCIMQRELQQEKDRVVASDEFNHVPFSVLRSSSKAALCAENVYLCEGYNELFNHIGTVDEILLEPKETKRVMFSMCTKLTQPHNAASSSAYVAAGDSSEEERAHLSETSCFVVSGRLILQPSFADGSVSSRLPMPEMLVPLQGQVCRSLLRLDVKELHFDDCVPSGSFVKDFTVWNRSEIPLLFKLVSPMTPWSENKELLVCTDYNSGYAIGDKTLQAAAYGHVRIRVTYRPTEIGERFFEIQAQNLHDSRNVKTLKIHAITNQEHHREGLSIKEPSGSYLMSGSRLDFGDCYTGIPSSKVILMRNMTEVALHVELTSDRPKEVTFELKLQQNRSRVSRAPRADELLSPTNSNDGSSLKGSLSPDGTKTPQSFSNMDAYGLDSDEEVDENEGDFYEEDFPQTKRNSFEENPMGDADDLDDDFEFDREPRAPPQSPLGSPKMRGSRGNPDLRKKAFRTKGKKSVKIPSRVRDLAYDSGVDSPRSSPERNVRAEPRKRHSAPVDDNNASNFLVETIDLPPGVERTILVWYSPASNSNMEGLYGESSDAVDLKAARLMKQTFRVSFRCFLMQGAWQQAQSRVYDRTLGKSIHIRARTCTSMVTVTPSILHLGDCNIGELKSSSCMLTNHSELPTVVKPLVTSKVISTVPNDDMMLGPKQSTELKIEIIPRKTNPNYSRLISIINMKNKSNIPQICVRSSNMDAHHVIYHSLFYKLLTQSRSAFLNFEHVTINSVGIQVFDLENITHAPLHLNIQSSAPSKVRLYYIKHPFDDVASPAKMISRQPVGRPIRRRRSFCSVSELMDGKMSLKRGKSTALRELLAKKLTTAQTAQQSAVGPGVTSISRSVSGQQFDVDKNRSEHSASATETRGNPSQVLADERKNADGAATTSLLAPATSYADGSSSEEVASLLQLFVKSRADCDAYCHSSLPSKEKEEEIVAMVRERSKRLQTLFAEKKLVLLNSNKERNLRIPAKSRQIIVAVFNPISSEAAAVKDVAKSRVEKHKIMITLPPGGNKKAVADGAKLDPSKPVWAASKHPFDTRPSVRELLLKSRVCRSVMNVNQKNINFGRIATSSKSSKRLVIKEGEVGVVKAFGTKEICFQFQPTLAGPFEEKLKIINVQDTENSVSVTIKAKVVKRETFKLLQSGQTISFGKCLVGEKTEEVKIAVRNTSRKKREYVIQLDPSFTVPTLRPTLYFSVDETPTTVITQAQEKKLDEELEKLEHKLRIATTKKKADKIAKLNAKISHVKALLSGEQPVKEPGTPVDSDAEATGMSGGSSEVGEFDAYDSANSESELSESESSSRSRRRRSHQLNKPVDVKTGLVSSSTNTLHFSLGAEATGRIVAYAISTPIKSGDTSPRAGGDGEKSGAVTSQKMMKRQLRRDATPIVGVGKFLLFEQQNKDVVKELQFNAEIFLRTVAGESAFCRAVGRKPPSALPPHPNTSGVPSSIAENSHERSFVIAAFVYRGNIPGQHNEQVVLRNLSGDRLDTSVLTFSVRVTRPVYVRIPELDPQATGQLEVLDLGPCYVIPEMQDTAADSPNVSLRFSKVHKLTLQSQVDHTLVICASSNLKTQCYVYEDARLHREATHVMMKGMQSIDLFVAIRPRLSSDAIKTGSTRDLVGGIRVQLFGLLTTPDLSGDEKSDMLAEFTVKFVGVAGASIARVTPQLIDFGVEYNSGRLQTCKTHEGRFELVNMSKALPLGYRLFVTNATEGYSDDDDSLHISLKHEKGEIPPGETGNIEFRMMAYTNGLFRRRIMVENIHYPGKVSFVDVVLFVDSGALHCEVLGSPTVKYPVLNNATDSEALTVQNVDFGLINVIKLEDELTDISSCNGENETTSRKYRIYGEYGTLEKLQGGEKVLVLTNTSDRTMVVRPLSTLPLTFKWKREGHSVAMPTASGEGELMARSTSTDDARRCNRERKAVPTSGYGRDPEL